MNISKADIQREVSFKASRSGGKGGQNVNKVSTKVELNFDIDASQLFTDEEKLILHTKFDSRLNKDGYIQVICDEERSQYLNREKALEKLHALMVKAFEKTKPRKATKVSRAAKAARLDQKKLHAGKKENRRKNFDY
ncbi:alternative ribosome rescue aminoacyl-tRNA hydrolase ArfB [Mucilaginibacter agri]|uniref:Aminoacyl-tRNA hydrolase n=1 Tax=Mucilaginibacter agri TaxID=2695265 RepID=A0A965ZE31_9SPHI|nr:alternative ribosome rescue aminoacyl-tRNA hydrolase ArfB [Mucilaginibacter agri]NCD68518.1 aminoacyl-tRNA hydrolase [Mucilaginibacter agri]